MLIFTPFATMGGGGGDGGNGHSGDKDNTELVVLVQVVLPPLLQVVMATLLAAYLGIERIAEHASRPAESSCPLRKAVCLAPNSFKLLFTSSHEKLKRV